MKKKYITAALLFIGALLICLSVILALTAAAEKNIIGGADFPTFWFVFCHQNSGIYSTLAIVGIAVIIVALIFSNLKKHKNK